jgi:hypothetical protein
MAPAQSTVTGPATLPKASARTVLAVGSWRWSGLVGGSLTYNGGALTADGRVVGVLVGYVGPTGRCIADAGLREYRAELITAPLVSGLSAWQYTVVKFSWGIVCATFPRVG